MEPIMKFVVGQYVNEDALANVVRYIYNGGRKLPPDQQIYGASGLIDPKDPELMISQMMMTREIFSCTSGPQCKHLVIAFGRKPNLPKKEFEDSWREPWVFLSIVPSTIGQFTMFGRMAGRITIFMR